ncbi:integrase core domain-containing protein [Thermincola ferriacetica]
MNEFNSPRELRIVLNQYIHEYNTYRPHFSIEGQCPAQVYDDKRHQEVA